MTDEKDGLRSGEAPCWDCGRDDATHAPGCEDGGEQAELFTVGGVHMTRMKATAFYRTLGKALGLASEADQSDSPYWRARAEQAEVTLRRERTERDSAAEAPIEDCCAFLYGCQLPGCAKAARAKRRRERDQISDDPAASADRAGRGERPVDGGHGPELASHRDEAPPAGSAETPHSSSDTPYRLAHEHYAHQMGKKYYDRHEPSWDELPEDTRMAWRAGFEEYERETWKAFPQGFPRSVEQLTRLIAFYRKVERDKTSGDGKVSPTTAGASLPSPAGATTEPGSAPEAPGTLSRSGPNASVAVPWCGCEKVNRCVEDRCPRCCYCGASWKRKDPAPAAPSSSLATGSVEDIARARAWLVRLRFGQSDADDNSLASLLADVRRETVLACAVHLREHVSQKAADSVIAKLAGQFTRPAGPVKP